MSLTVLLGGARSGKSALAVRMAAARATSSNGHVVFLATGEPRDDEMAARIARHRAERPAGWVTVEEPVDLRGTVDSLAGGPTLVVDCLTLWLANVLDWRDDEIEAHARHAARAAADRDGSTIAVSNEVGSGIVPADVDVRRYRDLLGTVNSLWADAADEAWLVVAGRLLALTRPHV